MFGSIWLKRKWKWLKWIGSNFGWAESWCWGELGLVLFRSSPSCPPKPATWPHRIHRWGWKSIGPPPHCQAFLALGGLCCLDILQLSLWKLMSFFQALQPPVPCTLFVTTCNKLNHPAVKRLFQVLIQTAPDIPTHHFIWLMWIFTSCLPRVFRVSGVLLVGLLELIQRRL